MTNSHEEFNKNTENGMKTFKFSNIQRSSKYNFKKEVHEFTLRQKNSKECSKNYVYFKAKLKLVFLFANWDFFFNYLLEVLLRYKFHLEEFTIYSFSISVIFSFWLDCSISKQNIFHKKLLMGWRGNAWYVSQSCLCYSILI